MKCVSVRVGQARRVAALLILMLLTAAGALAATWPQSAKLLPSDGAGLNYFGQNVAVSEATAIAGAHWHNSRQGAAYIFQDTGSGWTEVTKLTASDGASNDQFGTDVSVSGSTAAVGACTYSSGERGAVYIFQDSASGWTEVTKLTASDGAPGDHFAETVGISGSTVIAGAREHGGKGAVYIFQDTGSGWTEVTKLTASDGAPGDWFGSVAVSGNMAIVGAPMDDDNGTDSGSAYIFQDSGSGWTQVDKLLPSDGAAGDWWGSQVCISGGTAIVGSYWKEAAYIFQDTGSGWIQVAKLTASDGLPGDLFGTQVCISGSVAIVGAYCADAMGSDSGAAYVFYEPVAGWTDKTEDVKLLPSDGTAGDYFCSVAISGSTAIVGARGDDDNGSESGSAYIFCGARKPSGKITFAGRTDHKALVTISLKDTTTGVVTTQDVTTDAAGNYALTGVTAGTYHIVCHTIPYLDRAVTPITIDPAATLSLDFPDLAFGDANGDNCVDWLDIGPFSGAYGTCGDSLP